MKRVLGTLVGIALALHAHAQPAQAPLDLKGTAPITVTPSGAGNIPRVIACPTCGAGGINQLTGDVTAGPGSGSQPASITPTGVTPGTYSNAAFILNSSGYVKQASPNGGAVIGPFGGVYLAGRFYVQFNTAYVNSSFAAGLLTLCPVVAMSNGTITSLSVDLGTFTTAGNIELGIYADDGHMAPGNLLLDAGQISVAAVGVYTSGAISQAITKGTLYWLAFNQSVSIGQWLIANATQSVLSYRGHATPTQPIISTAPPCISNNVTFGPMPPTFTVPAAVLQSGVLIAMGF